MQEVAVVGLDLAKNVFQVHGLAADGGVVFRRQLRRNQVRSFFQALPACLIGLEACAWAHHWARELTALGHETRLMPPAYVKAYVKRGKTDAADAEAIAEAVTRPTMRFVAAKTKAQQAVLMLHKTRDLLVRQRTMLINAIRGHLGEFGVVAQQGAAGVEAALKAIQLERRICRSSRWPRCAVSPRSWGRFGPRSGGSSIGFSAGIGRTRRAAGSPPYRA
jgi:transposase